MRIVVISYLYPPVNNPQSLLSGRTVKYLSKLGHEIVVYAATPELLHNSSHGLDGAILEPGHGRVNYIRDEKAKGGGNFLWSRLIYHERYHKWVKAVVKAAAADAQRADVIYSIAAPLHSNFAGYELNRVTGTPWVAHFSDPIYRSIGVKFASPLRTFITYRDEEKLLRNAAGITFVNEETLQRTTQHARGYAQKSTVIPHCFEPEYFEHLRDTTSEAVTKVGYIGSLYSRRNPFEVIDAIEHVRTTAGKNIELHLYGTIEGEILEQIRQGDRKWIVVHGSVSYVESLKAMKAMDALLLIDMPDEISLFTPSKLMDYLAAERFVLGVTVAGSPTAKLLSEIGYPVVTPGDQGRLRVEISKIPGRPQELAEQHRRVTARFRADVVSKHLSSFLSKVAKQRT